MKWISSPSSAFASKISFQIDTWTLYRFISSRRPLSNTMHFSKAALLLAVLPFSIAATCDKSTALSWSTTSSGQAYDLLVCSTACGTNANCILACQKTACTTHCGSSTSSCFTSCTNDLCSAFYGSGSDSPNADALQACYKIQNGCTGSRCRRTLKKRATLTCSSSEGCYIDTQATVFCLNKSTGVYNSSTYLSLGFTIQYKTESMQLT